jgi:hypothetical protein
MMQLRPDETVQLVQDIPELGLHCGDVGQVCSTWFSPTPAYYEVEFQAEKSASGIRALLVSKQFSRTKGMVPEVDAAS